MIPPQPTVCLMGIRVKGEGRNLSMHRSGLSTVRLDRSRFIDLLTI